LMFEQKRTKRKKEKKARESSSHRVSSQLYLFSRIQIPFISLTRAKKGSNVSVFINIIYLYKIIYIYINIFI